MVRRSVSFLWSKGQPWAHKYPVGRLILETRLIKDEINHQIATEAIATQAAVGSILSEKGAKAFDDLIKRLTDGR